MRHVQPRPAPQPEHVVFDRIRAACHHSPILVRRCSVPGRLITEFASTALSQYALNLGDEDIVGVFHRYTPNWQEIIRKELERNE